MLSRDLIIDASGVINLLGGGIAEPCLQCIDPVSQVTPAIERECNNKGETALGFRTLLDSGLLDRCLDEIPADALADFIETHDLGAGESEAILACERVGKDLWCDDRRARNVARERLGEPRVTGTLGILLELVRLEDLTPEAAHQSYETMIAAGGFLPAKTLADFTPA